MYNDSLLLPFFCFWSRFYAIGLIAVTILFCFDTYHCSVYRFVHFLDSIGHSTASTNCSVHFLQPGWVYLFVTTTRLSRSRRYWWSLFQSSSTKIYCPFNWPPSELHRLWGWFEWGCELWFGSANFCAAKLFGKFRSSWWFEERPEFDEWCEEVVEEVLICF